MKLAKRTWMYILMALFVMTGLSLSAYAAPKKKKVIKMKYDCYIMKTAPTAALDTWLWDYVETLEGADQD